MIQRTVGWGAGINPKTGQMETYGDYEGTKKALEELIRRNEMWDVESWSGQFLQHMAATIAWWPECQLRPFALIFLRAR
jgi:hypothetical protein